MRLFALALALSCFSALALSAVEGLALSAVEAQPTFRSGVELVTIDVVATDRSGKPVHDLKASDFELLEDGKSQPIRTFQFIDASMAAVQAITPPGVVTNDVDPGGIFAVVLDDIGYYGSETQLVRREAERFLKTALQPHDHVVVVRSGTDSGFTLTTDHASALETAMKSAGRRDRGLGIEQPGGDSGIGDTPADLDGRSPGSQGQQSFAVLSRVVEKLRPIPARRKAIIWFSRGGELPPNFEQIIYDGLNIPLGRNDDALRKLINEARLANVAIYTVDPRGLDGPDTSRAQAPSMEDLAVVGTHRDLATETGGRALVNTNDIAGALKRVSVENRAYYLIGYEPAPVGNDKKPKARKIQVRTKAPGVELLHRAMYLPGSDAGAATTELIASPLPVRDLPIALAPAVVAIDKNKRGLLLPFEIGRDLRDNTEIEYSAMALDPAGKVVARANGRGRSKNGRLVGDIGLVAESKTYQVRFAARALDPEVNGLAFATLKVPDGKSNDVECTGMVFEQPGPREGLRLFTRDQPLTISTMIAAPKLDGAVSFGLGAAGGVPQRLWPATPQPLAKGLWRIALSLKAPLPTGNLEVRIMRDDLLLGDSCIANFVSR